MVYLVEFVLIQIMDPKEYETFILRLYNAGKDDTDAINEMHSFVSQPNALQIILNAISSHQISRITVLISLTCIPNVHISSPDDMEYLRSWFRELCLHDAESLLSDDFVALLANVFYFIYQGDQKSGSTLIQELSTIGPAHHNLSIQIILRIIEKSGKISHSEYLIRVAISPFANKDSPPQLIDSATLLLLNLLNPDKNRRDFQLIVIREGIKASFPQSIFGNLFKYQRESESLSVHLLELVGRILSFNASSYPTEEVRHDFIIQTVCTFFDYIQKVEISENKIPAVCSIFISLRSASSLLIKDDNLDDKKPFQPLNNSNQKRNIKKADKTPLGLYDRLIKSASDFTLFILSNDFYMSNIEFILDFWSNRQRFQSYVIPGVENDEIEKILEVIIKKFFTIESYSIEDKLNDILVDRSSKIIQKIVDFSRFKIIQLSQKVCQFLSDELDISHIQIAAFAVRFLAYAAEVEDTMNCFDKILNCVYRVQLKIPPQTSTVFELSLIRFFRSFLKRFVLIYSEPLRQFFVRFLIDIQSTNASIEIIQKVVKILRSKIISDDLLRIIAEDDRVFDLITKSQIFNSPFDDQPKKVTTALFQTLSQICFSMTNPDKIMTIINYICTRIESSENERIAYLMMGGCFMASNAKYESLFITLTGRFFPLVIKRLEVMKNQKENENIEKLNAKIVINILHLFDAISTCFIKINNDFMSEFIENYSNLTLTVLNFCLDLSEKLNTNSVEYLKILSNVCLILSNLLQNKSLNYGILEFYKKTTFQDTSKRLFGLFLMIPFDSFPQNPKLLDRYFIFIKAIIREYLTLFLNIDDVVLQHQLQLLVFAMNCENPEYSDKSIKILTYFASSLLPYETSKVEEKCQFAISCIMDSALKIVVKKNSSESLSELIYTYLSSFLKLRSTFFDHLLAELESDEIKDKLILIFNDIKNVFLENEYNRAINGFKYHLDNLISFSRSHSINLSL